MKNKMTLWMFASAIALTLTGCGERGGTEPISTNVNKTSTMNNNTPDISEVEAGENSNGIVAEVVPESE